MTTDNVLVVKVVIAYGNMVPAKHLHVDQPVLFGGSVYHVVDCQFIDDTNDVNLSLVRYDVHGKALTQSVILDKEFEIQTIWVTQKKGD